MHHQENDTTAPQRPMELTATGSGVLSQTAILPGSLGTVTLPAPATVKVAPKAKRTSSFTKGYAERFPRGVNWLVAGWMGAMHVAAVYALWHFTWPAFAICMALHFVSACFGITLGFHRLLTHGSLQVPSLVKYFFSFCGMLSAEGSPLMWVANHRKHHALSDLEGDPHSPNDGFWWSHFVWFHPYRTEDEHAAIFKRWAPDLYKDPVQRFMHAAFPFVSPLVGVALYFLGEAYGGQGLPFVLWGLCMRTVLCYHSTWFVNSATHVWGYRNYDTTDRSRNLWWVALASYGEGWHNNHHAHQRLAVHGHRWWEIDVTYRVIWLLKVLGLAWEVQDRVPEGRNAAAE